MPLIPYFSQTPVGRLRQRLAWHEEPQIEDVLRSFLGSGTSKEASPWSPRLDVRESKDAYVLYADLPGLDKKDIQVSVEEGLLSIRGERKALSDAKDDEGGWHRQERSYGNFLRTVKVGDAIDAAKVQAEYKDGVLTLTLPKKEAAKPKQITIA